MIEVCNKIKVIGVNGGKQGGYFIDPDNTTHMHDTYKPGDWFMYNDGVSYSTIENLQELSDGRLVFTYKDQKFYVDDGYRNMLVKAGYIIMNDSDEHFIDDEEEGKALREKFMGTVYNVLKEHLGSGIVPVLTPYGTINFSYSTKYTKYTVVISTISYVVNKNKERLTSGDSVYPFTKNNDKYCTLYFSIFAQRLNDKAPATQKFRTSEGLVSRLMGFLNDLNDGNTYRYTPLIIRRRLFYIDGEITS